MEEKFVEKEIDGVKNTNIEKLAKLFPSVVKDGQVDFEELKNELGDFEEVSDEKYEFSWVGKQTAKQEAQSGISGITLKYCPEESKDADTTENLYIEGDNLKVLKLLRNNYANKIKMIYIDPPYNTGTDSFIYPDNYKTNSKKMEEQLGISNDGEKNINTNKDNWYKNTKDSSVYHSAWLSMMYSRLKIAWELLKQDGIIYISIDEHEMCNLLLVIKEVFGENNFDILVWRKNGKQGNTKVINRFKGTHEYIIVAYKNKDNTFLGKVKLMPHWLTTSNPDKDPRGNWMSGNISKDDDKSRPDSPNYYSIKTPTGKVITREWFISEEEFNKLANDKIKNIDGNEVSRIYYASDGNGIPRIKRFENELQEFYFDTIIDEMGTFTDAREQLIELFNGLDIFSTPKPAKIIMELIRVCTDNEDIVLDFFSGSSTTADAVMQLNSEDNGKRKFIMVQATEECEEKSDAYKAGFKNICEIGKARIRRAGNKIKDETDADIDYGFKVFKLDETNINWEKQEFKDKVDNYLLFRTDEEREELLKDFVDGSKDIDIVYELILRYYGMPLSAKITKLDSIGRRTYSIGGVIIVCLEDQITNETIDKLSNIDFSKLYLRDSSFKGENSLEIKENLMIRLNLQKEYKNEKSYRVEFI